MRAGQQSRPSVGTRTAGDAFDGTLSLDDLDALARRVDGALVLLVRVTPANRPAVLGEGQEPPVFRRRVFLSAAAAERAVRAAVARGESCRVYLAELTPLHLVRGWNA